jgi:hypothetical protein
MVFGTVDCLLKTVNLQIQKSSLPKIARKLIVETIK